MTKEEIMKKQEIADNVADMVVDFIKYYLDENKKNQIRKCLDINKNLTSTYALQVDDVLDIHGNDSKTSGWYVILKGTRCGVNFFINNEYEITRKPRNVEVAYSYHLYNHNRFCESFWACDVEWLNK